MKKMSVDEEVAKTLASLDNVKRGEVGVHFEQMLLQKVAFLPTRETSWVLKFSAAAMLLMALANGLLLFTTNASKDELDLSTSMLYQGIDYTEFE